MLRAVAPACIDDAPEARSMRVAMSSTSSRLSVELDRMLHSRPSSATSSVVLSGRLLYSQLVPERTLGSTSVVEAVAVALRRELLDGSFRPGEVLRDTTLVDRFGVARPTIRAAVQALVAAGLLVRDRGRSARVPTFDADAVADLYLARRTVELAALEVIESRHRPLHGFAAASDRLASVPDSASWQEVADLDVDFHRCLVATANSPQLSRLFEGLANESRLLIAFQKPLYASIAALAAEHTPIFAALRARRYGQCRRLLEDHFRDAIASLTVAAAQTG
jgi:DNA-binding GntR family transcriptional regulator